MLVHGTHTVSLGWSCGRLGVEFWHAAQLAPDLRYQALPLVPWHLMVWKLSVPLVIGVFGMMSKPWAAASWLHPFPGVTAAETCFIVQCLNGLPSPTDEVDIAPQACHPVLLTYILRWPARLGPAPATP